MKVCLISGELFAWGKYGGFGRATRTIGGELVKRGIEVTAIVPRRGNQNRVEMLDGMKVLSFPMWNMLDAFYHYRSCRADIYHSQEPSLGTWLAMKAAPHGKHVITFRDTRSRKDWSAEIAEASRGLVAGYLNRYYEDSPLVHRAVRQADQLLCASYSVGVKARKVYDLEVPPPFMPTPLHIPSRIEKAAKPTVCFVARMTRRKRPGLFFDLARQFPEVQFIAIGDSRDPDWFESVYAPYKNTPNLVYHGFVDQFASGDVFSTYSKSWILVNPARREGLPNSHLEALAHGCALLSCTNPDDLSSRYGFHAERSDLAEGLRYLLEGNRWRDLGIAGRIYIEGVYEVSRAVSMHVSAYEKVLSRS